MRGGGGGWGVVGVVLVWNGGFVALVLGFRTRVWRSFGRLERKFRSWAVFYKFETQRPPKPRPTAHHHTPHSPPPHTTPTQYGSMTFLMLTTGRGVAGFTLDPTLGEFVLTHPQVRV